jgi:hypothetical protein
MGIGANVKWFLRGFAAEWREKPLFSLRKSSRSFDIAPEAQQALAAICDAVMEGVHAAGAIRASNHALAFKIMEEETRDFLLAEHYAGPRAAAQAGAQAGTREPLLKSVRLLVSICIAKIKASDDEIKAAEK